MKKNRAILKKAMTDRHARWSKKEWCSKSKPHWRSSAGEHAGQSSHDKWKSSKPLGKWKEISLEMDERWGQPRKKRRTPGTRAAKKASKESQKYTKWWKSQRSTKGKRTKKEACLRAHRRNSEKKGKRKTRLEHFSKKCSKTWKKRTPEPLKLNENCAENSWSTYVRGKKNLERPHYIMDKMWQMMQSNDTKTMNVNKDLEELLNKAQQTGWNGSTKTKGFWTEEEDDP